MDMVKIALFLLALPACAADFSLTLGPPAAAGMTKTDVPVARKFGGGVAIRLNDCADIANAKLSGTVEGTATGERQSHPLQFVPTTPGVYVVPQTWAAGAWVLNISATCGIAKAGAVVAMKSDGFSRELSRLLPRAATNAEVEEVLKALKESNR